MRWNTPSFWRNGPTTGTHAAQNGMARFGPGRPCIHAETLRSTSEHAPPNGNMTPMTARPLMTACSTGWRPDQIWITAFMWLQNVGLALVAMPRGRSAGRRRPYNKDDAHRKSSCGGGRGRGWFEVERLTLDEGQRGPRRGVEQEAGGGQAGVADGGERHHLRRDRCPQP